MNKTTETQETWDRAYNELKTPRISPEWKKTAENFFNTHLNEDINGRH